eukprot:TRINITY_DN11860_c0_g1_i1.p1 TRINITY_DN11860_c0_g1~~TRINITY_DN11860_c0_g1_i1.p1  ORF type:complete len:313 (+),score=118.56 TRINITY_DN11860_c0_g1_i1:135-1073(+)
MAGSRNTPKDDVLEMWDSEGCLDRVQAATSAMIEGSADTIHLEGDKLDKLNDQALSVILKELRTNSSVTHLDLSLNNITDAGAAEIAAVLAENTTLVNLELDGNKLTNAGVASLCDALRDNTTLCRLDISCHPKIDNAAAKKIADMLVLNTGLRSVHMRCCSVGSEGVIALANTLTGRNETLLGLYLSGNCIDDAAVPALCTMLTKNQSLLELGLANNDITYDPFQTFLDALEQNSFIQCCILSEPFRSGGRLRSSRVADILARNRRLAQERESAIHQVRQHYENELALLQQQHDREVDTLRAEIAELRRSR